jgi:hypothetical protein
MILKFRGNPYHRSETILEPDSAQWEGLYRGNRYAVSHIHAQPAMHVQLCYRGTQYER